MLFAAPAFTMDTIFKTRNRTRISVNSPSTTDLSTSIPYNQLSSLSAGPSSSTVSLVNGRRDLGPRKEDVSAPLSNPALYVAATSTNQLGARQDSVMPPPSAWRREGAAGSSRRSDMMDRGGTIAGPERGIRRATSDVSSSNGTRFDQSSTTLGQGRSPTPTEEFGLQSRHPYAASAAQRESDSSSVRTVSSISSAQQPIRESDRYDLGRYPSFGGSKVSISSRDSQSTPNGRSSGPRTSSYVPSIHSIGSTMALNQPSEEFHFPRPQDAEVEDLFRHLLEDRDLDASHSQVPSISSRNSVASISQSNVAKTTASLPMETKWQMVESDARARWDQAKELRRKEEEILRSGKAKKGTGNVHAKNSPEWFLKKVLNGTLTTQHLATLNISLRTLPLE